MSDEKPCQATPPAHLRERIMDSRIAKTEAEHWAARTISDLERENALRLHDILELRDQLADLRRKLAEANELWELLECEVVELSWDGEGRWQCTTKDTHYRADSPKSAVRMAMEASNGVVQEFTHRTMPAGLSMQDWVDGKDAQ